MATESITWPAPPDVTDATDGAQSYNMGRIFALTADAPVVGVEWRVPDSLADAPAGGAYGIALWDVTGGTRLAFKTVTPIAGGVQQFLFTAGDYLAGEIYQGLTTDSLLASIYTNHYVYAAGDDAGSTSPSGTIVAGGSRLADSNAGAASAPIPAGVTTLNFYVGPIVDLGEGDHTTTGTIDVDVTATGTSTTTRPTSGTVAATAAATAATATTRTTSGTASVAVTATAVTGSARVTTGTAPAAVTATATTATSRTTTGTATAEISGGQYNASATAAPRLVSRRRQGRIVTRTVVAS